jgi:hypothetical protein
MSSNDESIGSSIANGTQDLAALVGVFGTDSVERNALATQQGTISVAISSLSMLGLLGLVKSTLKITLGLDRCRAAGFNLDSIRGLFGYGRGEPASRGTIFECYSIKVIFSHDKIIIHRKERRLDDENTPMVAVGSAWKDGFKCQTVINLGNVWHEVALAERPWFSFFIAFVCSGITSWLLLVIKAPWNWTKFIATAGLHLSLMVMTCLPMWYIFRTGRPQLHLTPEKWDLLHDGLQEKGSLSILLVRINGGSVVHFQQDVSQITSIPVRFAGLLVSGITVTAYICQYAIVKTGSNNEVIIWITAQACAALLRILYWTFGTSFGLSWTKNAEYAIINNSTSDVITLVEILAACTQDTVEIPRWAWTYISKTPFWQILKDTTHNTHNDEVPRTAHHHIFHNVSMSRLIENRRRTTNKEDSNYVENTMWTHVWTLAVWEDQRSRDSIVRPFIVIPMEFKVPEGRTDECFIQAANSKVDSEKRLVDPCSMFACDYSGQRLHIQPFRTITATGASDPTVCTHDCPWGDHTTSSHEHKDSGISLLTDARVVDWLDWLLRQDPTDKGFGYTMQFDRERKRHIYVTASEGTTDRTGEFYVYEQAWTSRIHADLADGIADLRRYIVGEYNCDKLRKGSKRGKKIAHLVQKSLGRWMSSREPTTKLEAKF